MNARRTRFLTRTSYRNDNVFYKVNYILTGLTEYPFNLS
jgi:hypothetical protein